MPRKTFFGKGLEEVASEAPERKERIKGEEEWLVFAICDKDKAVLDPKMVKYNDGRGPQHRTTPLEFLALTPKGDLKQLASYNAQWTETNSKYLRSYINDFCGFNGKIYMTTNDCDWGRLVTLEREGDIPVRALHGEMGPMCSNKGKMFICGERYDDEDIAQFYTEQVVLHLDETHKMVGADVIQGVCSEGLSLVPHEEGYLIPTVIYNKYGEVEVWREGVLSHEGKPYQFHSVLLTDGETTESGGYSIVDEKGNERLFFDLGQKDRDGVNNAWMFRGELYLPGYFADKSKEGRGVAVYREASEYMGDVKPTHVVGDYELDLILPEHKIHSFKKVKYRDLAYLLEGEK